MSKPVFSIEKVSPSQAWEWLQTSQGNRAIREMHVAQLAAQMKRGEWVVNNDSVLFDKDNHLIDGHHRLLAVYVAETPVQMGVLRGVEPEVRYTVNTGKARTLADHLTYAGVSSAHRRAAYLASCVRLIVGQTVAIHTLDAAQAWEPHFAQGINTYFKLGLTNVRFLTPATVAGPLIVAFKADPEKMTEFYTQLRDGANLARTSPVLTLRAMLSEGKAATKQRGADSAETLASKVWAASMAFIEGRPLAKLQASSIAADAVKALYRRGNIAKMVDEARKTRQATRALLDKVDFDPVTLAAKRAEAEDNAKGKES